MVEPMVSRQRRSDNCKAELYLPPVTPRWARAKDLVAALGCTVVRERRGNRIGFAPQDAELLGGGRVYFPKDRRLHPAAWAFIAHEAVHHHVGRWSLEYEQPMLPFELELSRRIADVSDRRACYDYLKHTALVPASWSDDQVYVSELIADGGWEWTSTPLWSGIREECERKRLPMDGRLRSETAR
jgi:hypothetical protein